MENTKFGIVIGKGTGAELSQVFERVCYVVSDIHGVMNNVIVCDHEFESYNSLPANAGYMDIAKISKYESELLLDFYRSIVAKGAVSVFRTAMNAEALYQARQSMKAAKVERFSDKNFDLILVRDQFQGFYTGINTLCEEESFENISNFSKTETLRLHRFGLSLAKSMWVKQDFETHIVYKFHLFDNRFKNWFSGEKLKSVQISQPDTASRMLCNMAMTGNHLIIGSNEWVDSVHVFLIDKYRRYSQEECFSINHFLNEPYCKLTEYQTVHGSADDLSGLNAVNPLATIRAAASMLERYGMCGDCVDVMENAITLAKNNKILTRDMNGKDSTDVVTSYILKNYKELKEGTIGNPYASDVTF